MANINAILEKIGADLRAPEQVALEEALNELQKFKSKKNFKKLLKKEAKKFFKEHRDMLDSYKELIFYSFLDGINGGIKRGWYNPHNGSSWDEPIEWFIRDHVYMALKKKGIKLPVNFQGEIKKFLLENKLNFVYNLECTKEGIKEV